MDNKNISSEIEKLKIKVLGYKKNCELNIVGSMYKKTDNLFHFDLELKNFNTNVCKVYWTIAKQIIVKEKKEELDDITIGLYLEKHTKLKDKYEEYGGYRTILDMLELVNENNLNSYILENQKWEAILKMLDFGFWVDLKDVADLSAEEIYNLYEAKLNHIFLSVENEDKSYDIAHGIKENIEEWNKGSIMGLPYKNSEILTAETAGVMIGEVTMIGGLSGSGKSSFIRNVVIPSIMDKDEKILYIINEQDLSKTQREIIVWIANVVLKKDLQKYTVRNGAYTKEVWKILNEASDWLIKNSDRIKVLPFSQYTKGKTIKTIKKYASIGFKYFVLDTFKLGADSNIAMIIQQLKQDMVDLYDVIKPKNLNVSLTCTFQLNKGSQKERFYTQYNIGESKSIIDVAGCCIMIRRVLDDELEGGKNELKVFKLEGKNKNTKIPVQLKDNKMYFVLFIVKNREGDSNSYQIIVEHDLSRNIYNEVGICHVPVDF